MASSSVAPVTTPNGGTSEPLSPTKEAKGCLPVLLAVIMLASFWLLGNLAGGDDEDRVTESGSPAVASGSPAPSPSAMPSLVSTPSPPPSAAVTASPKSQPKREPPPPPPAETDPVVLCNSRPPATGEIYVRYITTDEPPTAIRLGGNWTWDFGEKECITSTEMALRSNPPLSGYCTQVALVSDNPRFDPDVRPAPQLRRVVGARGDC